ncbi:hydroxymethylglutaryl-CoA synthase family protein [Paractinoplanes atraurantiacus]|uniref:Polyketide biosynthesis 3-hydroxy-3-methylglutaryl-CoA synthase-like enzyme PksG n=1 Tax=Paractinoplanes atraurantiacus TaxID=1036182 RepID=A0A285GLB8_9ACTN|nr:hydroxymethylglutaryl-CoA synthase [Actinoplanes atraurantiacus]SNY24420.1 polyketide biosynthesis 3-hydroxy-3-methylglutaryl-CoA synthase-like enzyme PksG [Actinoplanes atraurantiacus]
MSTGIEAINAYVGRAFVDVRDLFTDRGLSMSRFDNLMMTQKSVNLPCEDPVTNAVNAARPLVAGLSPAELAGIELLVVGTESGLDFGKPISTYVHHHLGLPSRCRSFEVKHACYGGTAALQTAAALVETSPSPSARALVVAADAPSNGARGTYWEPSEGAGAVAMLVGRDARVLALDPGASGWHTYEVMDTARPAVETDVVDSDLSLLAYLSCLENCFAAYCDRVPGTDVVGTFDHLVFHTPFAGMVKGAHRTLLRKLRRLDAAGIERDFAARMAASLHYAARVGNLFSAAIYLALCSLLEQAPSDRTRRIGLFSYGSGCASEFFSGVVPAGARPGLDIGAQLDDRRRLTVGEYDKLTAGSDQRAFGVREAVFDAAGYGPVFDSHVAGRGLLVLDRIRDYHREYRWA